MENTVSSSPPTDRSHSTFQSPGHRTLRHNRIAPVLLATPSYCKDTRFWTGYAIIDFQAKGVVVVRLVGYRYTGFSAEGNPCISEVIAEVIFVIVAAGDGCGFAFFGLDKVQRAVLVLDAADVVGGGRGTAQDAYLA